MNFAELKTILTDIASSLDLVLQALEAGDQAAAEQPAEQLMESVKQFKEIIAKAEAEPDTPKEPEKPADEMAKALKEILAAVKGKEVKKDEGSSKEVKALSEDVKVLKDAVSEMLKGFGLKEEPVQPVQKGLNAPVDQQAFMGMLAEMIAKSIQPEQHKVEAGSNPIRKNVGNLAEMVRKAGGKI